jgi:ketosteroid isomerase-like protein
MDLGKAHETAYLGWKGASMIDNEKNIQTMRRIFKAVEQRDEKAMLELCQPDVDFFWPRSLPYGGEFRGLKGPGPSWGETWIPLQPTEAEQRMDPRVVAATDKEVVVLWKQRGITASGDRFEGPVLALYALRDGKLTRAQMFYFDTAEVADFLRRASEIAVASSSDPSVCFVYPDSDTKWINSNNTSPVRDE